MKHGSYVAAGFQAPFGEPDLNVGSNLSLSYPLRFDQRDVRQVTELLGVIETVSHDEVIVDPELTYSAEVHYQLFAADGRLIDSGADSVEDEVTSFAAAESALDQVVLHYLPSRALGGF